eukprot:TRINITY_DN1984_c0_g1_i1.p1 TRINITY_DN1984_c0_g1~~TRINITY_DN1984_c0_g1_i1.p1  ORF type:complete len:400 (-),score=161.87 TRINITY_DN1984_c0_g1_i1:199-1398(-)
MVPLRGKLVLVPHLFSSPTRSLVLFIFFIMTTPPDPTKFFGCELGAQSKYEDKTQLSVVNGEHTQQMLSELLEKFIGKFVLCGKCRNPETDMTVDKKKRIKMTCKACGETTQADPTHKLCTFIVNNPPNADAKGKGGKMDKKERRRLKELQRKKEREAAEGRGESPKSPSKGATSPDGDDQDDDNDNDGDDSSEEIVWKTDTSEAAARERQARELGHIASSELVANIQGAKKVLAEEAKKDLTPAEQFEHDLGNAVKIDKDTTKLISNKIKRYRDKIVGFGSGDTVRGFFNCLFTEDAYAQIQKHKDLFTELVTDADAKKGLLDALEKHFGSKHPTTIAKIAHALKFFYDEDVLEEEDILAWWDTPVTEEYQKECRVKAAPLATWLREADEESSEEESD